MEEFLGRLARIQQCVNGDGSQNLLSILKTCREMLRDRGFDDVHEHELERDINGCGLVLAGTCSNTGARLTVHICTEDRVGVKFARSVLETSEEGVSNVIVSIDGPTPFTRKECQRVQFFTALELCKNVTRHCLVPAHTRIEADQLPGGMRVNNLPRILETDRVVQYYGWSCGTVVKIKRVMGGYEPINYFRVVSPACTGA